MSKRKIAHINLHLTTNPQLALPSTTLTERQFCDLVNIEYFPPTVLSSMTFQGQQRYYFRKSAAHVLLNRVVALRGIQYRSHNYCNSFTATADINYAQSRNRTRSINCGIRNGNMLSGTRNHRGTWSAVVDIERNHLYEGYART